MGTDSKKISRTDLNVAGYFYFTFNRE